MSSTTVTPDPTTEEAPAQPEAPAEQPAEGAETAAPEDAKEEDEEIPEDSEGLKRELRRVRDEAAARRVEARDLREQLAARKSDADVEGIVQEYVSKIEALEHQIAVDRLAATHSLPEPLVKVLAGMRSSSPEALAETAKELASVVAPASREAEPAPPASTLDDLSGGLTPAGGGDTSMTPDEVVRRTRARRR